ncbi:hypothetical protein TVAG_458960 [Trichomonas vaginalis G3]|uniref:Uncharacterized protein n=1 Tax=Trichomonas vaginalis (strain ATCC PRA-98 / G3) TaxID=412133 RepID=A2E6A1_TRIV3|nr:hypothetical protein TVAGG3_0394590 [Trichomonas vaginalis G3]EAY11824.1 hypothetical protein TVAG_458960 [Trichomonas vaginalis G3]KAI5534242.1 hypothetical protein TVAGG3_0394590 [Trichomonas vaginalis G3]|eukprot:XP_001324047.1 hypothetical protein [Trichomonas vaginalis G3]
MQEFDIKGKQIEQLQRFIEAKHNNERIIDYLRKLFDDPYRKSRILYFLTDGKLSNRIQDLNGIKMTIFYGFMLKLNLCKNNEENSEEFNQIMYLLKSKDITLSIDEVMSYLSNKNLLTQQVKRQIYNFQNLGINFWRTKDLFLHISTTPSVYGRNLPSIAGYVIVDYCAANRLCSGQSPEDAKIINSSYITDDKSRKMPCNKSRQQAELRLKIKLDDAEDDATTIDIKLSNCRQAIYYAINQGFQNANSSIPLLREMGYIYGTDAGIAAKLAAKSKSVADRILEKLRERFVELSLLKWQSTPSIASKFNENIPKLYNQYKTIKISKFIEEKISEISEMQFERMKYDVSAIPALSSISQQLKTSAAKIIGILRTEGTHQVSLPLAHACISSVMLLNQLSKLNTIQNGNYSALALASSLGITDSESNLFQQFICIFTKTLKLFSPNSSDFDETIEENIREISGICRMSLEETATLIAYGRIFRRALKNFNSSNNQPDSSILFANIENNTLSFVFNGRERYNAIIPLNSIK